MDNNKDKKVTSQCENAIYVDVGVSTTMGQRDITAGRVLTLARG